MKFLTKTICVFMFVALLSACSKSNEPNIGELQNIAEKALITLASEQNANVLEYMYTALNDDGSAYMLEYNGSTPDASDWFGQVLIDSKTLEVIKADSYTMFFSGITGIMSVQMRISKDSFEHDWGQFTVIDKS